MAPRKQRQRESTDYKDFADFGSGSSAGGAVKAARHKAAPLNTVQPINIR